MKITKRFLMDNRTKSGAWTAEQLRIIGVKWPPVKGWQGRMVGKELTGAEVAEFILAKDKAAKSLNALEKCYVGVMKGLKKLTVGQLVTIRDEINKEIIK